MSYFNDIWSKDPYGKEQHEAGAKLDAGKPDAGLLYESFPRALELIAAVATYGEQKYSRGGWRLVKDARNRYKGALHRHLISSELEDNDRESGYPHLAHAAWNALAILELKLKSNEYAENESFIGQQGGE